MKKIIAFIAALMITGPALAQSIPTWGEPLGPMAPTPLNYGTGGMLVGKYNHVIGRYVGRNDSRSDLVEVKLGQEFVVIPYGSMGWYYSSERLTSKWDGMERGYKKKVPPPFAVTLPPVFVGHFVGPNCTGQAYSDASHVPVRGQIWNVNGGITTPGFARDVTFAWPVKPYTNVDLKSARDVDGKCVNWDHTLFAGKTGLFRTGYHEPPFVIK